MSVLPLDPSSACQTHHMREIMLLMIGWLWHSPHGDSMALLKQAPHTCLDTIPLRQ